MSQTSEREFYIKYDDQLLGVSIVWVDAARNIMPCGYLSSSYILLLSLRLQIELTALSFFERQRFEPFSKWILIYYVV